MTDRLFLVARIVSLLAALALVAQSEWSLALAVGWPAWIAWAAPLALDAYVLAGIRVGRDLGVSVLVSAGSVVLSHGVYAAPGLWVGEPGVGHLVAPLAAACSVVPLLVTWRVHRLEIAVIPEPVAPAVVVEVVEPDPEPVAIAPATPTAATTKVPRKATDADLLARVKADIKAGKLKASPSATSLRDHLAVGAVRAQRLAEALVQ